MIAAAKEIVRVHHAGLFVVFCIVGAMCGIMSALWIMFGGGKK